MSNRPNVEHIAYLLGLYNNSTIPQTYINEMSNYELLSLILNKVNEIIERCTIYDDSINEVINYLNTLDDKVLKQVNDYLEELKNNGYIAEQLKKISNKKILIIGDSYTMGEGVTSSEVYTTLLSNFGFNITAFASSGGGFTQRGNNGTFKDVLESYARAESDDNRKSYTDILFLGGVNDSYANINSISNDINSTVNSAHFYFVNATIQIGYISQLHRANCNLDNCLKTRAIYTNSADSNNNYSYISNSEYILKQVGLLQADGVHPNAMGHKVLANYLCSYLLNGNIDVKRYVNPLFTKTDDSYLTNEFIVNFTEEQHNGLISFVSRNSIVLNFTNNNFTCNPDTFAIPLGKLSNTLIWGQSDREGAFSDVNIPIMCECRYTLTDGGAESINALNCCIQLYQDKVLLKLLSVKDFQTYNNIYLKQINIVPFNIQLNADYC